MSKSKRTGYLLLSFRNERGTDQRIEITAILAHELVTKCLADLKRKSNRELRLRDDYVMTKRDSKWLPQLRVSAIPAPTRLLDHRLRLRTNAEVLNARAQFIASRSDLHNWPWILAIAAE